jgi:hypothetical protein
MQLLAPVASIHSLLRLLEHRWAMRNGILYPT